MTTSNALTRAAVEDFLYHEAALLDDERVADAQQASGLTELFEQEHHNHDHNDVRAALCRAQLSFLAGHLESDDSASSGLLLSLPLERRAA